MVWNRLEFVFVSYLWDCFLDKQYIYCKEAENNCTVCQVDKSEPFIHNSGLHWLDCHHCHHWDFEMQFALTIIQILAIRTTDKGGSALIEHNKSLTLLSILWFVYHRSRKNSIKVVLIFADDNTKHVFSGLWIAVG